MNARRHAGSLVLAIAAAASIATSYALPWTLTASAEIEPTFVTSGPPVGFAIAADADGPDHAGGDLHVSVQLQLSADSTEPATVRVILASADGDLGRRDDRSVVVSPGFPLVVDLFASTWIDCPTDHCRDDLLLTISEVSTGAEVTVSGGADIELHGIDTSPDPGSAVSLEITPLGVIRP